MLAFKLVTSCLFCLSDHLGLRIESPLFFLLAPSNHQCFFVPLTLAKNLLAVPSPLSSPDFTPSSLPPGRTLFLYCSKPWNVRLPCSSSTAGSLPSFLRSSSPPPVTFFLLSGGAGVAGSLALLGRSFQEMGFFPSE